MATQWWNPFDGDVIPGVNVGAGVRRVSGKATSDEDIISGLSVRGGARTTQSGGLLGRTAVAKKGDPLPPEGDPTGEGTGDGTGGTGGGGGSLLSAAAVDPDAAIRSALQAEIAARGGDVDSVYQSLFGELENLVRSRDAELEGEYGNQFKKAADTYAAAIPEIETSYAAIGAGDSTDNADAKGKAKGGYEETTRTIGKNKADDKSKLGAYKNEQTAKVSADRDAARRNVARAGETTDVGALRTMRNDLESNISNAGVTKATLGSDGQARRDVSALTADAGRYGAAVNALDSIIKSSMSGSVKEAAVKAIADNSGLSEEEKQKVNTQYGNVYAEQAAL